jgi:hypothetical protein
VVEVDVTVRDSVGNTDSGQPWWCGRVGKEADEGERAGDEKCGADERKSRRATLVQPEQDDGGDRQVECQVGDAEQPGEARQRICSMLHVPFGEEMQRPLEPNKLAGVPVRFPGVAHDEPARQLVNAVQGEHERCLEA